MPATLSLQDTWAFHHQVLADTVEVPVVSTHARYLSAIQRVGTNDEALKLGDLTTPLGTLRIKNMSTDPTHFVEVKKSMGGAIITRVNAGEVHRFRFDPADTAPAVKATPVQVNIEYAVTEN